MWKLKGDRISIRYRSWSDWFNFVTKILAVKAAKYEIQKPSTCRATLFRCKILSMFRVFHLA